MLNWILKFIPQQYKWSVAIKKASYTVGKLAVALLSMGKMKTVFGDNLTPEQLTEIQAAVGAVVAAGLEGLHDWAKIKFPEVKWL